MGNRHSADVIVELLLSEIDIASVVDVGCGLGFFCESFIAHGVSDVIGVDGHYVDTERLRFPKDQFIPANLEEPLSLNRTFDLAVCLEVAEHLKPASAPAIVDSLCRHGDIVLFSGATHCKAVRVTSMSNGPRTGWIYSKTTRIFPLIWSAPTS